MTRSSGADGGAEMDYDDASPLLGKDEDVEMGVKRTAPGSVNGVDGEEDPLPPLPDTTWYKVRAFVHHSVEGTFDSYFEYFILLLIVLNVIAFMIGTIPVSSDDDDDETWDDKYSIEFETFEAVSVAIFTVEYILRMWSVMEDPHYRRKGAVWGRIRYALTFFCIIDLISIVPFYIGFIPGVPDWDFWTALRAVRLVRLLKADKYVNAFALMGNVLVDNYTLLVAACYYAVLCLILFSTILYYTEHGSDKESAQYYTSIPAALFPTTLMLTGEFPLSDFTPLGQFFACIIAVCAVAIFAVPTAVLGSGFVKAVQDAQGKEFTVDVG